MRFQKLIATLLVAAAATSGAHAQFLTFTQKTLPTVRLLAKAEPDQCYDRATGSSSAIGPGGVCAVGTPKFNQGYAWSLAQTQFSGAPRFWIGTGANIHCVAFALLFGVTGEQDGGSWICEGLLADRRPPTAFRYDVATSALTSLEPEFQKAGLVATAARVNRALTLGYRAAGAANGVVLFAGPATLGTTFFAFTDAGVLIGSRFDGAYTNVRQMIEVGNQLYIAVERANGTGAVLRWRGTAANPFPTALQGGAFEVVGSFDAHAANIALYGTNRLAVTTWPPLGGSARASLFISPPFATALSAAQANAWTKVWSVDQYEPNASVARVLKGGALAFHDGWLVWGTMVDPGSALVSTLATELQNGGDIDTVGEILTAFYSTWRATAVFRGRNLETANPQIELLYGESQLPVYDHVLDVWSLAPNVSGQTPKYGREGFGNPYNNHLWSTRALSGRLYMGTMDSKKVVNSSLASLINAALQSPDAAPPGNADGPAVIAYPVVTQDDINVFAAPLLLGNFGLFSQSLSLLLNANQPGGDIWRFDNQTSAARAEEFAGLGNGSAYGFRNFGVNGTKLVVTTANTDNLEPTGGWEVKELGPRTSLFPF